MATLRERVEERYPDLLPLLAVPEIAALLEQAVDPESPLSPTSFQSKLRATQWYRGQSESQRNWWITFQSDPGQANLLRNQYRAELSAAAIRMGTPLSGAALAWLTERGLAEGLSIDSAQMQAQLRALMKPGGGRGDIGVVASQIRALAEKSWYVRPSAASIYKTAGRIVTGLDTVESANARFAAEAARRFPHLGSRIQGGETLADITADYRQTIAEELELGSPEAVDPMRGEWRNLLGVRDPKSGKMRMMTHHEVVAQARNRPAWWQTQHGRQTDAQAAGMALRIFGARA